MDVALQLADDRRLKGIDRDSEHGASEPPFPNQADVAGCLTYTLTITSMSLGKASSRIITDPLPESVTQVPTILARRLGDDWHRGQADIATAQGCAGKA